MFKSVEKPFKSSDTALPRPAVSLLVGASMLALASATSAQTASTQASADSQLETVIVTANKVAEPLQKVVAINDAAQRSGVEPGMTRIRLQHFFDVVTRQRSQAQEESAHAALLDCAAKRR